MNSIELLKLSLDNDTTTEELLLATVSFLHQDDLAAQKACFKASEKINLSALLEDGTETDEFQGLYLSPVPVVKKYKQVALTKDNLVNVLTKYCCGKDDTRASMQGVYFDANHNCVVATDAQRLCKIPFEVGETELLKKGRFEPIIMELRAVGSAHRYPDYQSILRKDVKPADIKPFNHDSVLAQIEGALLMLRFISRPVTGILLEIGDDAKIYANAQIVYDVLIALKTLGQTVDGIFFDSPTRSIEFYSCKTCVGLFIPVLQDSKYGTHLLRVAIELA